MDTTYIAQTRLKVGHDDETDLGIYREVGDEVPEAHTWSWTAIEHMLRNHRITEAAVVEKEPEKRPVGRPRKDSF